MSSGASDEMTQVIGPNGTPLTLDDLPHPSTRRWVARRKAEVVTAVRSGLLTFEQACERYNISHEEFACWEKAIDQHGMNGLRVTKIQDFRS